MKSCLRIPRLFLPDEDYEGWCSPADGPYEERENALNARSCLYRDGDPSDAEHFAALRKNMYRVLADRTISRLFRGMVLVKRTTPSGVRKGLLAAADLEEYSLEGSKTAMIRPLTETDPSYVENLAKYRKASVLEIPHAVLCYRDKRMKILRALDEGELERLYDISPRGTERLEGFFIPDFISAEVIEDLCHYADPCFGILSGNHSFAAAKQNWERVRTKISEHEARNHPARFALAEFVDLADPAVELTAEGRPVEKDDILSALKSGKRFPPHGLQLETPRLCMEAREITYD